MPHGCQIGNAVEVKGVITSDVENNAWQIGSPKNEYMLLGDEFYLQLERNPATQQVHSPN
jgi:hypothetical protein